MHNETSPKCLINSNAITIVKYIFIFLGDTNKFRLIVKKHKKIIKYIVCKIQRTYTPITISVTYIYYCISSFIPKSFIPPLIH